MPEIESWIEAYHRTSHMTGEYMSRILAEGLVNPDQAHMFGAHHTIGIYSANRMMDAFGRELEIAKKEIGLIEVTRPGLIDLSGNPLRKDA